MSVPTVTLTGTAIAGAIPAFRAAALMGAAGLTEIQVKLGAVLRPDRHAAMLGTRRSLATFFSDLRATPPPATVDYYSKAMGALGRMYLNDREGCCVISGKLHNLGTWSANDADSGGVVTATDAEVQATYNRLKAGPGDSGCIITDVLDAFQKGGITASGKTYTIDGYVAVDNTNVALSRWAVADLGVLTLGLDLPGEWTNSDVWDVTDSRSVGGHDVSVVGYDGTYFYISSWGRIYKMTVAAFTSKRYVTECYGMLAPTWYGPDRVNSATGIDLAALKQALADIGQGNEPAPGPAPAPPPPPVRQVVVIPDQVIGYWPFRSTVKGGTYPVTTAAAGFGLEVSWLKFGLDVGRLAFAVARKDVPGAIAAALVIASDLGIHLNHPTAKAAAAVDWFAVAKLIAVLVADLIDKNWSKAGTDVADLIAALGY